MGVVSLLSPDDDDYPCIALFFFSFRFILFCFAGKKEYPPLHVLSPINQTGPI